MDSVDLDPEKKLVYVTGRIDPSEIIKKFEKWQRKAQVVSSDKNNESKTEEEDLEFNRHHSGKGTKNSNDHNKKIHNHREKKHCNHIGDIDSTSLSFKVGHEPEKYVPSKEEDIRNICRDPYCRIHAINQVIKTGLPGFSGSVTMLPHRQQHPYHYYQDGLRSYPPPGLPHSGLSSWRTPFYGQQYLQPSYPTVEYPNLQRPVWEYDNLRAENNGRCRTM